MEQRESGYVIAESDGSSDVYIPHALHIERDDSKKPWVYEDDTKAARGAEKDGVCLIYGMEDVENGVYLDTPENRAIIAENLDKYPEYRLVKLYGRIPEYTGEINPENLETEDSMMSYVKTKPSMEPQDAEKLTDELNKYKELQDTMKAVNAYWRKTGTCMGAPGITSEQAAKLDEKIRTTNYSWERQPFSSYDLTNNNSQIKRLEQKLAEVSRGFEDWEFEGGRAEANADMNRLQLFFDEKPSDRQRTVLKANGFKWAPSQDAWQRQLNDNAIYAAGRIDFIKPSDGRTVREHQPKQPARDAGAR